MGIALRQKMQENMAVSFKSKNNKKITKHVYETRFNIFSMQQNVLFKSIVLI